MAHTFDINSLLRQAQMALQSGQFAEAERILSVARQAAPRQAPILFLSSRAARSMGQHEKAVSFLYDATIASPRDGGLLAEYASALDDTGKVAEAIETYDRALALAPNLLDAAIDRAVLQATKGQRKQGLADLRALAAANPDNLRVWKNLAIVEREHLNTPESARAAKHVLQRVPQDPRALLLRALAAADAGEASADLFRAARAADPQNPDIPLREAGALANEGRHEHAEALLMQLTDAIPDWLQAHRALADVRWESGTGRDPLASYAAAVTKRPQSAPLWAEYADRTNKIENEYAALRVIEEARNHINDLRTIGLAEARIRSLCDDYRNAEPVFDRLLESDPKDTGAQILYVHWLARMHRFDALEKYALALVDSGLGPNAWPYVSVAWRGLDDPRWHWLEQDGELARAFELEGLNSAIPEISDKLRSLHVMQKQPLEQSLRGGTQTSGMIFANPSPEIRVLRHSLEDAVADYIATLPKPDPKHPLLSKPREQFRFTGGWSVRLLDSGFHVPHFHSMGDISSACYLALPDGVGQNADEKGWLTIGEPPAEFGLDWSALKTFAPKLGRLALFPSWTWHGTRPFDSGERMTVAFDTKLG